MVNSLDWYQPEFRRFRGRLFTEESSSLPLRQLLPFVCVRNSAYYYLMSGSPLCIVGAARTFDKDTMVNFVYAFSRDCEAFATAFCQLSGLQVLQSEFCSLGRRH